MGSPTDDILNQEWEKNDMNSFLKAHPEAQATDDAYQAELARLDKMHADLLYGDSPPPAAASVPTGTYINQSGRPETRPLGQAGFVANSNGSLGFRTAPGAPMAPEHSSFTDDSAWAAQFQPRGIGARPSTQPAIAPLAPIQPILPPAFTPVGQGGRIYPSNPNTTFSQYGTVTRNPIAGSSFSSDASMEQIRVAPAIPNGIDWPALPKSPVKQYAPSASGEAAWKPSSLQFRFTAAKSNPVTNANSSYMGLIKDMLIYPSDYEGNMARKAGDETQF